MEQLISPKQLAQAIGVSESSLKRWCDQGLIETVRTAGGHRRIPVQEALRFAREQNYAVVEPRLLSLPAVDDRRARRVDGSAVRMSEALLAGNESAAHGVVFDLYLAGHSLSLIFDQVVASAFRMIGDKWECHEADVYQERCSCQITLHLLHELRARLAVSESAPLALGATMEGDQYVLPATMAEVVLRSAGWDARLLGNSIPFDSMLNAIRVQKPGLFWLSVSHIRDEAEFVRGCNQLFDGASELGTALVVGGRVLTSELRAQLRYSAFGDTMQHLEDFARTLIRKSKSSVRRKRR